MIPIPLNAATRIGLSVFLFLAGVIALYLGQSVIVPMLISLLLATVLGPAAVWLHQTLKIRWGLACSTVVIGLVVASVLITSVFSASIVRLGSQLSNPDTLLKTYTDFRARLDNVAPFPIDEEMLPKKPDDISKIGVFRYLADAAPYMVREATRYTANWSWQAIIILFITFFVLLEGKMLARRAVEIFGPSEEVQSKATAVLFEVANQVRTYIVWRTIINLGLAIVMGTVFQLFGLTQAWTWAILLAIINYIPYFGPILASIPPFLDAFIFRGPGEAIGVTVIFWIVIVIEGYLIVPVLMGRNMDLNATTVMLACLFWELVWGTTGLFLAMPIMAGIKAVLYHVPEWRVWANLMSTHEVTDPKPPPDSPPPADASFNGKPGAGHAEGISPEDSCAM